MKRIFVCCVATMLTTTIVLGTTATKSLEATYRNIKVIVDGKEVTMKDPNGNSIEPFIVNGTTYLPVRAVSEALGKEVSWVESLNSIIIGEAPSASQSPAPISTPVPTPAPEPSKTPEPTPSTAPDPKPEQDKIYTFGETFIFDNFELTINDEIEWVLASLKEENSIKYKDQNFVKLPVVIKNIGTTERSLNKTNCYVTGPKEETANYSAYEFIAYAFIPKTESVIEIRELPFEFTNDIFKMKKLEKDESEKDVFLYIAYSETGDYTIEFKKDNEKKVVRLFMTKPTK